MRGSEEVEKEKDTMLRVETGNGLFTVDKQGVVKISAPVITESRTGVEGR